MGKQEENKEEKQQKFWDEELCGKVKTTIVKTAEKAKLNTLDAFAATVCTLN